MPPTASTVYELRQYTLHPGQREVLIELFERELVDTQREVGIEVIGPFRDLDRPDRFVWLRGFADVASRGPALEAFYGGPAWQRHRDAANATMTDWHDALLLRPAPGRTGFEWDEQPPAQLQASLFPLHALPDAALAHAAEQALSQQLQALGAREHAQFVTDASPNGYPRLPLREGEPMWVCFHTPAALRWPEALQAHLAAAPQQLNLAPTAQAALRMALTGASA
nr:NIPSNAP family protein [uncultured Caldimonas sp.]